LSLNQKFQDDSYNRLTKSYKKPHIIFPSADLLNYFWHGQQGGWGS